MSLVPHPNSKVNVSESRIDLNDNTISIKDLDVVNVVRSLKEAKPPRNWAIHAKHDDSQGLLLEADGDRLGYMVQCKAEFSHQIKQILNSLGIEHDYQSISNINGDDERRIFYFRVNDAALSSAVIHPIVELLFSKTGRVYSGFSMT